MKKTTAAITIVGALLAGCVTPTSGPTATPTRGAFAPGDTATPIPAPTSSPIPTEKPSPTREPSPTPTPDTRPDLELRISLTDPGSGLLHIEVVYPNRERATSLPYSTFVGGYSDYLLNVAAETEDGVQLLVSPGRYSNLFIVDAMGEENVHVEYASTQ